jgi:glycosyltransferase involved in cell wall biosynthesis
MKAFQIYRDVTFHATSMHEADDIKKWFGQESQIVYISNLSRKIPKKIDIKEKVSGKLKVVFIGRIAQEKNLKYAIELINNLEGVSFDIYGPVYDKRYENECRELSFNEQQSIEFHAAIAPQDLRETISKYHVLLFPSTGENFGHVIIESLSFGLPVLISDKTPWKNLEENKAGMVIDLADRIAWLDGILFFKKLNQEEYNDWSGKAHRYALNYSNNKETLNQYMELFSI